MNCTYKFIALYFLYLSLSPKVVCFARLFFKVSAPSNENIFDTSEINCVRNVPLRVGSRSDGKICAQSSAENWIWRQILITRKEERTFFLSFHHPTAPLNSKGKEACFSLMVSFSIECQGPKSLEENLILKKKFSSPSSSTASVQHLRDESELEAFCSRCRRLKRIYISFSRFVWQQRTKRRGLFASVFEIHRLSFACTFCGSERELKSPYETGQRDNEERWVGFQWIICTIERNTWITIIIITKDVMKQFCLQTFLFCFISHSARLGFAL